MILQWWRSTVGTYQINVGLDTSVGGTGWGAGTYWNDDGWGDATSNGLTTTNQIRLWSHDNFGEDLIINARDSNIYYWDKTNNLSTAAVELSTYWHKDQRPANRKTGAGIGPGSPRYCVWLRWPEQ